MRYSASPTTSWRRYTAVAGVAAIHVGLFFVVANLRPAVWPVTGHELQVNVISPNLGPKEPLAPPLDWQFQEPEDVVVPMPEITITADQQGGGGILASGITQQLAPRIDPAHLNVRPALAASKPVNAIDPSVMLRLLVSRNGSVGNAEVVRSTGDADSDRTAINFVMNNWRFLPASVNGKSIDAWMTVVVRFAST